MRHWGITATLALATITGSASAQQQPSAAPAAQTQGEEVKPRRITLDLDGVTAEEAFAQLSQQAGIKITAGDSKVWLEADPIILKVENANFWSTLLEMLKQAKLTTDVGFGGRSGAINVYQRNRYPDQIGASPTCQTDGFFIVLQHASRNYSIGFSDPKRQPSSNLSLQAMVFTDPGMMILQNSEPKITKAVDESGQSVAPPQSDNRHFYSGGGQEFFQHMQFSLDAAKGAGKKLSVLEGTIPMQVVSRVERIVIDNPTKSPEVVKDFPKTQVTIQPVTANGSQYSVKVLFKPKTRNRDNSVYWSALRSIQLLDAEGNIWNSGGGGGGGMKNGAFEYNVSFYNPRPNKTGEPAKLVWLAPVETKEVEIPFSFKDIPLP